MAVLQRLKVTRCVYIYIDYTYKCMYISYIDICVYIHKRVTYMYITK